MSDWLHSEETESRVMNRMENARAAASEGNSALMFVADLQCKVEAAEQRAEEAEAQIAELKEIINEADGQITELTVERNKAEALSDKVFRDSIANIDRKVARIEELEAQVAEAVRECERIVSEGCYCGAAYRLRDRFPEYFTEDT